MGLWVHVSDTREHRLYAREASRAPSRELKRVSAPKSYSVAILLLYSRCRYSYLILLPLLLLNSAAATLTHLAAATALPLL